MWIVCDTVGATGLNFPLVLRSGEETATLSAESIPRENLQAIAPGNAVITSICWTYSSRRMLRNLVDRSGSSMQKFSGTMGTGKALQGYMPGDVLLACLFAVDHLVGVS